MCVGILKEGEKVRIVDSEKKSDEIYVIKKIETSKNDIAVFLLKSDSSNDHIIFYDSKTSHLEKISD
jgi:stress response protein SCP2